MVEFAWPLGQNQHNASSIKWESCFTKKYQMLAWVAKKACEVPIHEGILQLTGHNPK